MTGHTGDANTAVKFTSDQTVETATPREPAGCGRFQPCGGIVGKDQDGSWMVDGWFQLHSGDDAAMYVERLPGTAGGVIILRANAVRAELLVEPFDGEYADILDISQVPKALPPGGLEYGHWYYIAGVLEPSDILLDANGIPVILDANGDPLDDFLDEDHRSILGDPVVTKKGHDYVYLYDGTTVFSGSHERSFNFIQPFAPPQRYH